MARALDNKDALDKALHGDYQGAAESMTKLAEVMPEGKRKELAVKAADKFEEAREAQLEELPGPLAESILDVEPIAESLKPKAAEQLLLAADAARAQDYDRARNLLNHPLATAPADKKAALQEFGTQLDNAAKKEKELVASLPQQTRLALEKMDKLATRANPVAQAEFKKAADAVKDRQFHDAADHVAAASLTMPKEKQRDALRLTDNLAEQDRALYGGMNRPAREAVGKLEKNPDQWQDILEAARDDDYTTAADLARKNAENEAAKLFQEAAGEQESTLPELARAGLEYLQQAERYATPEQKRQLQQAELAARKGDFKVAEEMARKAAEPRKEEVGLAEALARADAYRKQEVGTLEQAMTRAGQNKLNHAAALADRTEHGAKAAKQLADAGQALNEAAHKAFNEAYKTDDVNARNQLRLAAQNALADNIDGAIAAANMAGKHGEKAKKALAKVKKSMDEAKKTLQKAIDKAKAENQAAQRAADDFEAFNEALTDDVQEAKERQLARAADEQAFKQAMTAMDQNRFADASKLAGKAKDTKDLARKIRDIEKQLARGARTAEIAGNEAQNDNVKNQLKEAARLARAGDITNAEAKARAAGKPGERALAYFQEANKLKDGAREDMANAAQQAGNEAAEAGRAAQATQARQNSMKTAKAQMDQNQLGNAAGTMRTAAQGEFEAEQAAQEFAGANEAAKQSAAAQRRAKARDKEQSKAQMAGQAESPEADVATAVIDVKMAEGDLAKGEADTGTTENLEDAGEALDSAAGNMARMALARMDVVAAENEAEWDRFQQSARSSGGGRTDMQKKPAKVPDDKADMLGDSWAGVDAAVSSDDKKRRKMQYNDYYRKANQSYFEAILRLKKNDEKVSIPGLAEEGGGSR